MTDKKVMDVTKMWDYRVVRKEYDCESGDWYSVQEVYYDEDGTPMAQTIDLMVEQDTITGMRTQLEKMINCLGQPVLDERDMSDTAVLESNRGSIEERLLTLEMENSEMRDRLTELGDVLEETKKLRSL